MADADKSLEERVEHLGMLADDAEARGAREEAAARHEDRIEAATAAAASLEGGRCCRLEIPGAFILFYTKYILVIKHTMLWWMLVPCALLSISPVFGVLLSIQLPSSLRAPPHAHNA